MAECATTPTATQFETITTSTTSSTFSESITTVPNSVSTVISPACLLESIVSGATVCLSTGSTTQLQTIRGGVSTAQVPVILTIPVTQTVPTATLFTTSCGPTSSSSSSTSTSTTTDSTSTTTTPPPPSSTTTSTSSSKTTSTLLTTSSILTTITPPPTTFTSESSSTLPNGQVVTRIVTITSTGEPSVSAIPTTVPDVQANQNGGDGMSNGKVGVIIGCVVGGFVGICLFVFIGWLVWKRTHRDPYKDMFDSPDSYAAAFSPDGREQNTHSRSRSPSPPPTAVRRGGKKALAALDLDATPKPYHYGLVGHPGAAPESDHGLDSAPESRGRSPAMVMAVGAAPVSAHGHTSSVGHGGPSPPLSPGGSLQPRIPPGALTATSTTASHRTNHSLTLANSNPSTDPALVDAAAANPGAGGASTKARLAGYAPSLGPQDVVQHRDGGRVPLPAASAPASSGPADPAPPAYAI